MSNDARRIRALSRGVLALGAAALCLGGFVGAEGPSLARAADPTTVSVPHGDGYARGRSTIAVDAPIDRVRETILDFAHYPDFMPHYSRCKILGRTASGARDVYMEVSALHGAVRMWARVEVPKPSSVDGFETYETRFVDGNVRELKAIWRLKSVGEGRTELSLEVFLNPGLPLPKRLVNQENLDGSAAAVMAAKKRIERR